MRAWPLVALLVLSACKKDEEEVFPTGEGLFSEGCPLPDQSLARLITVDETLPGDVAVGSRRDFLLANDVAAFVITEPHDDSVYWYYGGIVADAVAMDGCTPVGQDELDEMGPVLGSLNLADISSSVLRAFEATAVEVVNDGSDGRPARVRATGVDSPHWLVEYTLVNDKVSNGGRPMSEPFGLELQIDYVLAPGSQVLREEWTFTNVGEDDLRLLSAHLLSFAPSLTVHRYASAALEIGPLDLETDIPWLVATDGTGAYAFAPERGNLAYQRISGIDIAIDIKQGLTEPIEIRPGQSESRVTFLSVGATDGPSATAPLVDVNPEPLEGQSYTVSWVSGRVVDLDGDPIGDARVSLEADGGTGFGTLDEAWVDDEGRFRVAVPDFTTPWDFQLVARAPGRDTSDPVSVAPGDDERTISMGRHGLIHLDTRQAAGPMPTRVVLQREDGLRLDRWTPGVQAEPVPPGRWNYTVTRGYEFAPATGQLTVPDDGEVTLSATLDRVVDTTGWLSADSHVHTEHSPDSDVPNETQLLHAAAHGLDIVIHTEHEHIIDQSGLPAEAGLEAFIGNVNGEEVTAVMPEHHTLFPAEPDGSPRGGFVEWYELDIAELHAAMRERSPGGVSLINHPGYMDKIDWDYVAAAPRLDDPTLLGWPADATIWSWNIDGIEVMNGHGSPFGYGDGRFEKWQSGLNTGHDFAGVGCSDDHHGDQAGFPRTYFASSTDDPAAFDQDELVASYHEGRLIMSAGAFARVDIDGAGPGELAAVPTGTADLSVRIEAMAEADITHVIVFANCDMVAKVAATDPTAVVKLDTLVPLTLPTDTQITVAAFGSTNLPAGLPQYNATRTPRVLTNPIFVDTDDNGVFDAPGGRICDYDLSAP